MERREVSGKVPMTSSIRGQYAALALTVLFAVATLVASSPFASAAPPKRHHSSQHPDRHTAAGARRLHGPWLPADPGRLHAGAGTYLERVTGYDLIVCPPGIWPLR